MSKLTSRERSLIYLGLLICLWVFSYRFLFQPLVASYTNGKHMLAQAKAELNELETYQLKVKTGKTKHKEYGQKLNKLDKSLTNTNEAAELLDQVKQGIEANKLTLLSVEISEDNADKNDKQARPTEQASDAIPGLKQITAKVAVQGEYPAITKLIKDLYEEEQARNVVVKQIEFTYDEGLEAEFEVAAYVLNQQRPYKNNKVEAAAQYKPDKPFGQL